MEDVLAHGLTLEISYISSLWLLSQPFQLPYKLPMNGWLPVGLSISVSHCDGNGGTVNPSRCGVNFQD
jgi:hypothetical protein